MSMSSKMVFLRGFMTPPSAYDELLSPVRALGTTVMVPKLYGASALRGKFTAAHEATAAIEFLQNSGVEEAQPVWWVGHSRGGQVAWLAATQLWSTVGRGNSDVAPPAGVIVIDPVDGAGRRPRLRTATARPAAFPKPPLVIGFGRSGACAPAAVGYRAFAEACPVADVVVMPEAGHADILSGRWLPIARRLCPGGSEPALVRREVSRLLVGRIGAGL